MKPISLEEARAKNPTEFKGSKIVSNYSYSVLKKRELADSISIRFSPDFAVKNLWNLTHGRCPYCSKQLMRLNKNGKAVLNKGVDIQWDHFIAVYFLGPTTDGNIIPLCSSCNNLKGGQSPFEFQKKMLKKGKALLTKKAFKKFFKEFTAEYKKNYPEIYAISLDLAKREAEELEIRKHMGFYLDYQVEVNGKMQHAFAISGRNSYLEQSPSRPYFEPLRKAYSAPGETGQRNAISMANKIWDQIIIERELDNFSPTQSIKLFKLLCKRIYEHIFSNEDGRKSKNTIRTSITKMKAVLEELGATSEDEKVREFSSNLPTYANYRDRGFEPPRIAELTEEDTQTLKDIACKASSISVNRRINSGGLNFLIRKTMGENNLQNLKELNDNHFTQVKENYINYHESLSTCKEKMAALNLVEKVFL